MKRRVIQALSSALLSCCIFCNSSINTSANESACYLDSQTIEYCFEAQEAFGISAALIASIIQAESSGQEDVKAGSCWGAMQVSTSHVADPEDLLDMEQNIRFGVSVLDECREKAEGDVVLALMYYNGISDAKAKWQAWIDAGNYDTYPNSYVAKVLTTAEAIETEWYGR